MQLNLQQNMQPNVQVNMQKNIAVIGSGITGLSAAWHLVQSQRCSVTLFEADARLGGHAHTVDMTLGGKTFGVDTGFLVFNHRTYPEMTPWFEALGVPTAHSEMSFSVQVLEQASNENHKENYTASLFWCGNDVNGLFAQRKNIFKPSFWRMVLDIIRFNRAATAYALTPKSQTQTLGEFLQEERFSDALRDGYLVPMAAAIWSCPTATMMAYPMATFSRFCYNHGLLQIINRPQWYTVKGGSREYVNRVADSIANHPSGAHKICLNEPVLKVTRKDPAITLETAQCQYLFDAVVFACHTDQALDILQDATAAEVTVLGAIPYQDNEAVLHTDAAQLPPVPRAYAAWNYERVEKNDVKSDATNKENSSVKNSINNSRVCLHYLLNRLQPLPAQANGDAMPPVIVSLNPIRTIDPAKVVQSFHYSHPVFSAAAIAAQAQLPSIQGDVTGAGTWFAGAWANYGFHEDGFVSGKRAAHSVLDTLKLAP